jgi:Outer membrane lipoprotein-sorting protein
MKFSRPRPRNFSSEGTPEISQPQSGWCLAQNIFQVPQGRRTLSTLLSGRNFLRTVFQPLRGWLISGRRSATQFVLAALILFFAIGATAQTTNPLSYAEIQGRQLAQQILEQKPTEEFTQRGILRIRDGLGNVTNIFILFQTRIDAIVWRTVYIARPTTNDEPSVRLEIVHESDKANRYLFYQNTSGLPALIDHSIPKIALDKIRIMRPFVNSDFWLADLGLEFFHWPAQKILKKENRRGRGCMVLESTNPDPSPNGYLRVVSWIDEESGGIVHAEAFDAQNNLLKEFDPKSFKKVKGQWELRDMEIRNVQTGSRTRIQFDLKQT